jgi:hypothetical protein
MSFSLFLVFWRAKVVRKWAERECLFRTADTPPGIQPSEINGFTLPNHQQNICSKTKSEKTLPRTLSSSHHCCSCHQSLSLPISCWLKSHGLATVFCAFKIIIEMKTHLMQQNTDIRFIKSHGLTTVFVHSPHATKHRYILSFVQGQGKVENTDEKRVLC